MRRLFFDHSFLDVTEVSVPCADLGVQLCGQPLTWDDVRPFKLQFYMFDISKTGKLSSDDLEAYITKMEEVRRNQQVVRLERGRRGSAVRRGPERSVSAEISRLDKAATAVQASDAGVPRTQFSGAHSIPGACDAAGPFEC